MGERRMGIRHPLTPPPRLAMCPELNSEVSSLVLFTVCRVTLDQWLCHSMSLFCI